MAVVATYGDTLRAMADGERRGEDAEWEARLERFFSTLIPHNKALGVQLLDFGPSPVRVRLPYRDELVGNPATGAMHGGAITALMDLTCGAAVFMTLRAMSNVATLDLRIDYLEPTAPGRDIVAEAECYKLTRSVAFVRGAAYHDDPDQPIAACAGTFMVSPPRRAEPGSATGGNRPGNRGIQSGAPRDSSQKSGHSGKGEA